MSAEKVSPPPWHPPVSADATIDGCPLAKGGQSNAVFSKLSEKAVMPGPSGKTVAPAAPETKGPVYNVYSQEIDPKNMMPAANQNPSPGQKVPLPTERVKSNIPKGGTDGTWLYPSPQMFWNSLVRKNKVDGVEETDVPVVVSIHNEMNERTWQQLLDWEQSHKSEHHDGQPSLRRFMGNPYKLSPKAWLKSKLGFGFPFDRHDWFVDRGDRQVHYVIDYYYNPNGDAISSRPEYFDASATISKQVYVDVRPAVEDFGSFVDRLVAFPRRLVAGIRRPYFPAEGIDPSKVPEEQKSSIHSSDDINNAIKSGTPLKPAPVGDVSVTEAAQIEALAAAHLTPVDRMWNTIDRKCANVLEQYSKAETEEKKRPAFVALNYCMGTILCPDESKAFMGAMEAPQPDEARDEAAFNAMARCVAGKAINMPRSLQGAAAPNSTQLK